MNLLLSYWTLTMVLILFLGSVLALTFRRKNISAGIRVILIAACVFSVIYLAFIMMVSIGFGSNAHPPAASMQISALHVGHT